MIMKEKWIREDEGAYNSSKAKFVRFRLLRGPFLYIFKGHSKFLNHYLNEGSKKVGTEQIMQNITWVATSITIASITIMYK